MKKSFNFKTLVLSLCCLFSIYTYGQVERPEYVLGQVLVKMKANRTATQKNALKNQMKASLRRTNPHSNVEVWDIDQSKGRVNVKALVSQYRNHPDIEYIEPNYYYYLATEDCVGICEQEDITPGDPLFSDLWGMHNTGQNGGIPDADIDAPEAWDIATGSPSIVVGLIDTGIDWKHPDLVNNIWQNLGEDADGDGQVIEWNGSTWIFDPGDINGIDDDGNNYPDDFIGWDFINNDNDPFDSPGVQSSGHGTHVAGTLGAEGNNGIGVAGVTWDVQIAGLRIFAGQNAPVSVIAEALDYAVMMDMPISNNSYAGGPYCNLMIESLNNAEVNGHLFVAAAGNRRNDNDSNPTYPSSYPFDNIISVAATDWNDLLWNQPEINRGSHYGATSVDIAAPGRKIKSTFLQNDYSYKTGTSMATPHVTGACALLWEQYPTKAYAEIKDALLNSVDILPDLSEKCVSEGRLNLYEALTYFDNIVPLSCREQDSLTLVDFYNATDGVNWTNTWDLSQLMDTWYGVTLNGDGCVTELELPDNNLNGIIPVEIGDLVSLTSLNLLRNELTGNIPLTIENLINLTYLNLGRNQLNGSIPTVIGNLTNLTYLRLSSNQLNGSIPATFGNLVNLTVLWLSTNWLIGGIPVEIGDLINLTELRLNANALTGNIPIEIGTLTNLTDLHLFSNDFTGFIPSEIGNLAALLKLRLYDNQLIGSIPIEISNLSSLIELNLSQNELSGNIPVELGNLIELTYLNLGLNSLTDTIPSELGNLIDLTDLLLYANQLTGNIPPEIGNLNNLTRLYLSNNQLSGLIPPQLEGLSSLLQLYLHTNQLSGSISSEIGNLGNLTHLNLYDNNLSGCYDSNLTNLFSPLGGNNQNYKISDGNNFNAPWEDFYAIGAGACNLYTPCRQIDSLALVALYNTTNGANWTNTWNLNQPIDTWYGVTLNESGCVFELSLIQNGLNGVIPLELGSLSNLSKLYLGKDYGLNGLIPTELGNLNHLTDLRLYKNSLSGTIPIELANLSNLTYIRLSSTLLTGNIPIELSNLSNLTNLLLYDNELNGLIPIELANLNNLISISLHNNNLSGSLPAELGNLNALERLHLQGNELTGNIPTEFVNLSNLEDLHLYNNQLTGSIPPELASLYNLTSLRLFNNQLSGCYDENLMSLCSQLNSTYNTNTYISDDNNFDASWEDFCNIGAGTCPCRQSDSLALVALYNATNGPNWTNSWDLSQPINTWTGVTLNGDGCVRKLILSNRLLTGNIPPTIGNFSSITDMWLVGNSLSGSIPPEIGDLSSLGELRLSGNQLTGSIPPEIGDLNNLVHLWLNSNELSSIPLEIGNLTNLARLYLHVNMLEGSIPPEIGNLINLQKFWAYGNELSGSIPSEIGSLNSLTELRLHGNQLSGAIPPEIGLLVNLGDLWLNSNYLTSLPSEIGNLTNLFRLNLQNNMLSGSIPSEIGNLTNLVQLWAYGNQFGGNIPPEIGNLERIVGLRLNANNLSGSIPPEIGLLSNLGDLWLDSNQLSGSIPPEMGNLNLNRLFLKNNLLEGCYDFNLIGLCSRLNPDYNINSAISDGNNFDALWEDFCTTGAGTCALVWPGDYNYDGIANETDALYWGLAESNTGDTRSDSTTAWQGQQAPDWSVEVQGINGKHQDGDGNGLVDGADLQILNDNFGNIHAYNQVVYIASTLVYDLVETGPVGGYPSYDLYVRGSEGDTISVHGLAAVIDFGDVSIDDITLRLDSSSLSPSDTLKILDTLENRLHIALTRTDGVNQLCTGPVANFIVITQDIPSGDSLKFDIETGNVVQANGDMATIADMSVYSNYPSSLASNELVVGAAVIHEQCNISGSIDLTVEGGEFPYTYVWNTGARSSSLTELTPNIYEVTVTDADGQMKTLSVEVQGQYISIPDEFGNFPECTYSPCPTLLTPNGTIYPGTYKAGTTVNSTGIIDGSVQFKAGEMLILRAGFEVPPGKSFSGTIEDCEN